MGRVYGVLIKLGDKEWIDRFLRGEIFMRPLREFVELFEGDALDAMNTRASVLSSRRMGPR